MGEVQSARLFWLLGRKNESSFFLGRLESEIEVKCRWLGKIEENRSDFKLLGLKHIHIG